ncbi:MAG: hypothetical protein H8D97_00805 [Proteobacteria bacterium]|nr:hypothetical protein [Pseudomonadota bacterium]
MLKTFDSFDIGTNEIKAKYTSQVIVDPNEYGDELIETASKLIIPGILDIYIPEFEDTAHIVLDYNVNLRRSEEVIDNEGKYIFTYQPGDLIASQDYKNSRDVMRTTISLMEGRVKYIKNPNTLLTLMHNVLTASDTVHLELILANMFRDPETGTPARFDGRYDKAEIIGQQKQGKRNSWLSSLSYREIDKSINTGLINDQEAERNPIEKLLEEDFSDDDDD